MKYLEEQYQQELIEKNRQKVMKRLDQGGEEADFDIEQEKEELIIDIFKVKGLNQDALPFYHPLVEDRLWTRHFKPPTSIPRRRAYQAASNWIHIAICYDQGDYNVGMKALINSIIKHSSVPVFP